MSQNPRTVLRITLGVILAGGLLSGLGLLLREAIDGTDDQWTFLLDSLGLLVTAVGAFLDVRANAGFGENELPGGRRRAGLMLLGGLLASTGGCYLLGWVVSEDSHTLLRAVLTAAMTAGIGCILAGLLYIGWFGGGDHLERRIQQRSEEQW